MIGGRAGSHAGLIDTFIRYKRGYPESTELVLDMYQTS